MLDRRSGPPLFRSFDRLAGELECVPPTPKYLYFDPSTRSRHHLFSSTWQWKSVGRVRGVCHLQCALVHLHHDRIATHVMHQVLLQNGTRSMMQLGRNLGLFCALISMVLSVLSYLLIEWVKRPFECTDQRCRETI
jgi:hypothetical protein